MPVRSRVMAVKVQDLAFTSVGRPDWDEALKEASHEQKNRLTIQQRETSLNGRLDLILVLSCLRIQDCKWFSSILRVNLPARVTFRHLNRV